MATYRVCVNTGPLSKTNFDHILDCLRQKGAIGLDAGTENVYFKVVANDQTEATIVAQDLLVDTFGSATNLTRGVKAYQLCGLNPNHLGNCGP